MESSAQNPVFTKLMEAHNLKVRLISSRVKSFHSSSTPFRIYHGSTNSTRPTVRNPATSIDTSNLNSVLSVSVEDKLAIVEPNVPMDILVRECLKKGLVPPVVPEFPGITVGGGFAGTAGESTSWKYGFLDATVEEIEIITGDGEVRKANAGGIQGEQAENQDLFYGAAGTLGSLGVLTLLHIRLIEAKSHVKLTYTPVSSYKEAVEGIKLAIKRAESEDNGEKDEFIEGIMFSPTSGAVITGSMVEFPEIKGKAKKVKEITFSKRWDEWYYLHVQKRVKSTQKKSFVSNKTSPVISSQEHGLKESPTPKEASSDEASNPEEPAPDTKELSNLLTDYIPLEDYLFRYDRGGFWVGRLAFSYFQQPFTRFGRWLYDPFLHTRAMYHALHESGLSTRYIIEDLAVPFMGSADRPVLSAAAETGTAPEVSNATEAADTAEKVQDTYSSPIEPLAKKPTDLNPAESLLTYLETSFSIFPLWLCPLRLNTMGLKPQHIDPAIHPILLNVGVWGPYPSTTTFSAANKEIEREMFRLGGTKWLYAHTFYTKEEFWAIYDKQGYDQLRNKFGAEYLPDVWDKVKAKDEDEGKKTLSKRIKGFWVFAGLYGLLKTVVGKDYIMKKGR
jgi:delta24-sterol reductase